MSGRAEDVRFATKIILLTLALTAGMVALPLASGASTIEQGSPLSGTTDVAGSSSYSDFLAATSGFSGTVSFATSTSGFTIVGDDELETTQTLSAADSPYVVSGDDSDGNGDSGSWSYQLTVTPDTITQTSPPSNSVDVAGSSTFSDMMVANSGFIGPVTFTTSTPGFTIANNDELETTGTLSAADSPYIITGEDSDAYGDTGTWSYQLTVTPDTITQGLPATGTTSAAASDHFTTTLSAATGFIGPVTFTTSTPDFMIANNDELETTGALSAADSPYMITGGDSDAYGDTGTWSYVLTAVATLTTTTLTQTSATTGTVSAASSATFTAGPITVAGASGAVAFTTSSPNSVLTVSASGAISTTGALHAGTYSVSGTDTDTHGDSGTWSYTLSVTAVTAIVTVTFDANGGTGTTAPESASAPTALTLNGFHRSGYTFLDWNTKANGSGESYANGVQYSFVSVLILYAQWKQGKAPERTITFRANAGTGTTPAEVENSPTVIKANRFTRAGYKFVDWNTKANGSGARYQSGATYAFKKSIIFYAQWKKSSKAPTKKPPKATFHVVTFNANGGAGTMASERRDHPAALSSNLFRRTGYTFVDWSTAANGKGDSYANGVAYSFDASTELYAQWKMNKPAAPPPTTIPGGLTVGPFSLGSSSLTSNLESQIRTLANDVRTGSDTQITLYGFGDKTVPTNETNVELGRQRADAVATYLGARLTALGLNGWTISVAPASPNQFEYASVIATLS